MKWFIFIPLLIWTGFVFTLYRIEVSSTAKDTLSSEYLTLEEKQRLLVRDLSDSRENYIFWVTPGLISLFIASRIFISRIKNDSKIKTFFIANSVMLTSQIFLIIIMLITSKVWIGNTSFDDGLGLVVLLVSQAVATIYSFIIFFISTLVATLLYRKRLNPTASF